jgi:uncharacterized radical SAM superfamily protein
MENFSPENVWVASEKDLLSLIDSVGLVPEPRKVRFYAPNFTHYKTAHYCSSTNAFPTISVTGSRCALNCGHCGGKVLEPMHPANTPTKLFALAEKLKQKGALGCLVSGGCLPNGSVPLKQFIPTLGRIKRELGLTVIVHTGLLGNQMAEALKSEHIDSVLIDVIGSDETIKQVCNLNASIDDYEDSLRALHSAELSFVPHVIVGLHNGTLKGELQALKIISKYKPSAVVIIAFMPIRGTAMEAVHPPSPLAIVRVVATARLMFPETPLALGCMRPKGKHRSETDVLALKAGVDAIAFPSDEVINFAERSGFEVAFSPCCCSQIYVDATA